MTNRFDLSRAIPAAVKLVVRQNCRFGCVLCRSAVCDYEHIDPPFANAREHDPDNICLLCPSCHSNVTRGRMDKSTVRAAYEAIRANASPDPPRDDVFFSMFDRRTEVVLGGNRFQGVDTLISVDGKEYLKYWPTTGSPPYVITGVFNDDRGRELFRIEENEWVGPTDVFDVEQLGPQLRIRTRARRLVFRASKHPASGVVCIDVLDMLVPPFHLLVLRGRMYIGRFSPDLSHAIYTSLYEWSVLGGRCGLSLLSEDLGSGLGTLTIDDRGYRVEGTGITIAPESVSMTIGGISVEEESWRGLGLTAPQRFRRRVERRACDGSI